MRKRGNGKSTCAEMELLGARIQTLEKSVDALSHVSGQITDLSAQMNSIKADLTRLILLVESPTSADKSLIVRIKSLEEKLSSVEMKMNRVGDFAAQVGVRVVAYFAAGILSGMIALAAFLKAVGGP